MNEGVDFFDPFSLVDGTEAVKTVPDDYYFTDAITQKSVEYIKRFSQTDKPFFLCHPLKRYHINYHSLYSAQYS